MTSLSIDPMLRDVRLVKALGHGAAILALSLAAIAVIFVVLLIAILGGVFG